MAKTRKASRQTRKHEKRLDGVWAAVQRFDHHAPIGAYHIDALFADDVDAARRARRLVYNIVLSALHRDRHRVEFPKALRAAETLFDALRVVQKVLEGDDTAGEIASVLALTEPNGRDGSSETEEIADKIDGLGRLIDTYLASVWHPDFIDDEKGNATIRFDHDLIDYVVRSWRDLYGRAITRSAADRNRATALTTAAMNDFDYPAPPASKLNERIRHHRLWK